MYHRGQYLAMRSIRNTFTWRLDEHYQNKDTSKASLIRTLLSRFKIQPNKTGKANEFLACCSLRWCCITSITRSYKTYFTTITSHDKSEPAYNTAQSYKKVNIGLMWLSVGSESGVTSGETETCPWSCRCVKTANVKVKFIFKNLVRSKNPGQPIFLDMVLFVTFHCLSNLWHGMWVPLLNSK